ncbi:MAG: hypothetical protein DMG28_12975 [Acidobacteria bacterium]|nr:MAG: hypothetical protein DMG28_12975 [Acidobacteriota bacterium]
MRRGIFSPGVPRKLLNDHAASGSAILRKKRPGVKELHGIGVRELKDLKSLSKAICIRLSTMSRNPLEVGRRFFGRIA